MTGRVPTGWFRTRSLPSRVGRWKQERWSPMGNARPGDHVWIGDDHGERAELVTAVDRKPGPGGFPFGFRADEGAVVLALETCTVVGAERSPIRLLRLASLSCRCCGRPSGSRSYCDEACRAEGLAEAAAVLAERTAS